MKQGYFITGTDTGVGKTYIASALVRHFTQQGMRAIGMKPVAAGCELKDNKLLSGDVIQLMDASNVRAPLELVNPYAFAPPIAPHIAAEQAGISIELDIIQGAFRQLANMADVLIVEGVGGLRVPLGDGWDTADLAQAFDLPMILVVGMRLGCINHALLAIEAIHARGLTLAGWVANQVDSAMSAPDENFKTLAQQIPAPCIARVEWGSQPFFSMQGG